MKKQFIDSLKQVIFIITNESVSSPCDLVSSPLPQIDDVPKAIRNNEKPTEVLPIRNCNISLPLNQLNRDSAVGLHLLQNPDCAAHYNGNQFSISAKVRTQFHLAALISKR